MPDALTLPAALLAAAITHLRACLPLEGVGYFAGPPGGPVTHWLPLASDLASPTAFRTSPESALAAHKAMRAAGADLLAVAHSHPTSPPVPSAADRAGNPYGNAVVWVIVGFAGPEPEVRAWRLTDAGHVEVPLTLTPVAPAARPGGSGR